MLKESIEKQLSKINKEVDIYIKLQKFDTLDMKAQLDLIINSPLRNDRIFLEDWTKNLLINKDYKEIEVGLNDIKITYKNAMVRISIHSTFSPISIIVQSPLPFWNKCGLMNEEYKKDMSELLEKEQNIKTFYELEKVLKKHNKTTYMYNMCNSIFFPINEKKYKLRFLERNLKIFKGELFQEQLRQETMEKNIAENIQITKDKEEFLAAISQDQESWEEAGLKVKVLYHKEL
ncbi:MAG: hypothetical protein RR952_06680 [Cetobacterium sp.]